MWPTRTSLALCGGWAGGGATDSSHCGRPATSGRPPGGGTPQSGRRSWHTFLLRVFAKYAEGFFKMSRCWRATASSWRSRRFSCSSTAYWMRMPLGLAFSGWSHWRWLAASSRPRRRPIRPDPEPPLDGQPTGQQEANRLGFELLSVAFSEFVAHRWYFLSPSKACPQIGGGSLRCGGRRRSGLETVSINHSSWLRSVSR